MVRTWHPNVYKIDVISLLKQTNLTQRHHDNKRTLIDNKHVNCITIMEVHDNRADTNLQKDLGVLIHMFLRKRLRFHIPHIMCHYFKTFISCILSHYNYWYLMPWIILLFFFSWCNLICCLMFSSNMVGVQIANKAFFFFFIFVTEIYVVLHPCY